MKKLATLAAVAALAGFGWAGDADAGVLNEAGEVTCTRTDNPAGILDDEFTVMWKDVDADFYTVTFMCMDLERGSGKGTAVDIDDPTVMHVFTVGDVRAPNSVKDEWVCEAWVKPKKDEGPNDGKVHISGHDECNLPVDDN